MKKSVIFMMAIFLLALPVMAKSKKISCLEGDTVYSWQRDISGEYEDNDFYNFYFSLKEGGKYLHLFVEVQEHFMFLHGYEALFQWDKSQQAYVEMFIEEGTPLVIVPLCQSNEVSLSKALLGKVRDTHRR